MKFASVILFVFLIAKSTFGGDVVQLLQLNCCNGHEKTETKSEIAPEGSEDTGDCCNLGDCNCVCCVHLLLNSKVPSLELQLPQDNFYFDYQYQNNYKLLYQNLVWHPPKELG